MMRCVVLCVLALAVAAAPYLKDQAANAEMKHAVEKRSQETIGFGNVQNHPRKKKSDPLMAKHVRVESPKAELPTKQPEELTQSVVASDEATYKNNPVSVHASVKTPANDESSNLKQLLIADQSTKAETGSRNKINGNEMSNAMLGQIYAQPRYVPYSNYYYQTLRQAFRRKRRAATSSTDSKRRRTKRGLGYDDSYYPYGINDDESDEGAEEENLDDEEIASVLAPYIKEAIRERYGDELFDSNAPAEDDTYNADDWSNADNRDDLVDSYLRSNSYQDDDNDDEYDVSNKRSGLLGDMPGNRRKRFEYPYSLEPQGHWGAFVPSNKRARDDEMYAKLYELASILARRNAYSNYLDALEAYKK